MTIRILTLILGVSLALSAAHAQDTLTITETGENFNDLKATLNRAPFAVTLTGAADAWTLELPAGYSFSSSNVGTSYFMPEPENPTLFNEISITQPTLMLFSSEVLAGATFGTAETNPFTLSDGGTGPTADFELVVADAPARAVPDTSSTLSLFGVALAGLAFFGTSAKRLRGLASSR
jgi:hypothetical protein